LLLAFLVDDDPLSQWFKGYVQETKIAVEEILRSRNLDRAGFEKLATTPFSLDELVPTPDLTSSATDLLTKATNFRNDSRPKLRDIMAAYIYEPVGHEEDLMKWGLDRPAWSNAFLAQIARPHPHNLRLDASTTPWLRDEELLAFFREESAMIKGRRLSASTGKGIW
jgi:hypothetical protein